METGGTAPRDQALVTLARLVDGLVKLDGGEHGAAQLRFRQVIADDAEGSRIETGHAWRGLAEAAMSQGDVTSAEDHLKQAVRVFREAARLRPATRARAQEGEALVLMLGGELMARRGQAAGAEPVLARARLLLQRVGDERTADAWMASGRLARAAGDVGDAESCFDEALRRYDAAGNVVGRAEVLLDLASLRRDPEGSAQRLDLALSMARDAGRLELASRVLLARGTLLREPGQAIEVLSEALELATQVGARPTAGLVLVALGARGWDGGERPLVAGAQVLLDVEHYPALGFALQRLAEHGVSVGDADLALAACEAAWRVYRSTDPVDGVGRVLKIVAAAFAVQRAGRSMLTIVHARAALVGRRDASALVQRDSYASKAPPSLVARLTSASRDQLLAEARRTLQAAVLPALRRFGLAPSAFATAQGALDVLGVLSGVSPRGAARQLAAYTPSRVPDRLPEAALPDSVADAFKVQTVARIAVASVARVERSDVRPTRSRIYDPDGRLADMVRSGLSQVDEQVMRSLEAAAPAPDDDEAFPEDEGWSTDTTDVGWLGGNKAAEERDEPTEETARRGAPAQPGRPTDGPAAPSGRPGGAAAAPVWRPVHQAEIDPMPTSVERRPPRDVFSDDDEA